MKIRLSIICLAVAALALVPLLIWFGRPKPAAVSLPNEVETNSVLTTAESATAEPTQRAGTLPVQGEPAAPSGGRSVGESKGEKMLNILSNYNDMPIVFYGKVEDQFEKPVAGAAVDFSVRVYNGYESTVKRGQQIADGNGFFTISGYKGESLSVVPKKGGYALASRNGGGKYSHLYSEEERIHPDPNKPVVVKMWKLQGAEPLLGIDQKYKLHYSDMPIYFDLLAGKVVPAAGDLKITVSRAPGVMSGRNRLGWSVQIEAVDGGLMDSSGGEATTYWAPADGYQPKSTLIFPTNAWAEGFNRGFFVTSRNGQVYSKLGLSFTINYNPDDVMYISFRGVANTNGSRNWEGDPNTFKPQ